MESKMLPSSVFPDSYNHFKSKQRSFLVLPIVKFFSWDQYERDFSLAIVTDKKRKNTTLFSLLVSFSSRPFLEPDQFSEVDQEQSLVK